MNKNNNRAVAWLLEHLQLSKIKHVKNTENLDEVESTVSHRNIIKKKVFFTNYIWNIMEYSKRISKIFLMV